MLWLKKVEKATVHLQQLTVGGKRKFIPPRSYKGRGMDGPPPPPHPLLEFLICCIISKRFYLQRKAFDLLNKMCYILGVVALLAACDVTNNSHYLGRYLATSSQGFSWILPRIRNRVNTTRNGDSFVLDMKNKTHK